MEHTSSGAILAKDYVEKFKVKLNGNYRRTRFYNAVIEHNSKHIRNGLDHLNVLMASKKFKDSLRARFLLESLKDKMKQNFELGKERDEEYLNAKSKSINEINEASGWKTLFMSRMK